MMRKETIGHATLYLGDSRDLIPNIGNVDALITDPPYGVNLGSGKDKRYGAGRMHKEGYNTYDDTYDNYLKIVVTVVVASLGIAKRGAVFSTMNLAALPRPDAIGGVYISNAVGRHCWGFNSLAALALYGKAPALNMGARPTVITGTDGAPRNGHPCPKPIKWMEWVVGLASLPSELVFDPFMGSGTTGVAAITMGRGFIGCEIDAGYFDIACKRIEEASRHADLFAPEVKPKPQKAPDLFATFGSVVVGEVS